MSGKNKQNRCDTIVHGESSIWKYLNKMNDDLHVWMLHLLRFGQPLAWQNIATTVIQDRSNIKLLSVKKNDDDDDIGIDVELKN